MPLGIVSDNDFDLEISRHESIPIPEIKEMERGRGNTPEVPESIRAIIGETSITDGRSEAIKIAQQWGISTSSVSAYANSANSTATYNKPNGELKNHINRTKERITNKARKNLFAALSHITTDKLAEGSLREVSGVARDMSSIIKDFEPDTNRSTGINAQFIFYTPKMRSEESFEIIDVVEQESDV